MRLCGVWRTDSSPVFLFSQPLKRVRGPSEQVPRPNQPVLRYHMPTLFLFFPGSRCNARGRHGNLYHSMSSCVGTHHEEITGRPESASVYGFCTNCAARCIKSRAMNNSTRPLDTVLLASNHKRTETLACKIRPALAHLGPLQIIRRNLNADEGMDDRAWANLTV